MELDSQRKTFHPTYVMSLSDWEGRESAARSIYCKTYYGIQWRKEFYVFRVGREGVLDASQMFSKRWKIKKRWRYLENPLITILIFICIVFLETIDKLDKWVKMVNFKQTSLRCVSHQGEWVLDSWRKIREGLGGPGGSTSPCDERENKIANSRLGSDCND